MQGDYGCQGPEQRTVPVTGAEIGRGEGGRVFFGHAIGQHVKGKKNLLCYYGTQGEYGSQGAEQRTGPVTGAGAGV